MFHISSKTAALGITLFTIVLNVGLQYLNIPEKAACTLTAAAPTMQAAAAGAIGK